MSAGRAPGSNTGHAHAVGTLAEEAGQLLDAVTVRLTNMKAAAAGGDGPGTTPSGPVPDQASAGPTPPDPTLPDPSLPDPTPPDLDPLSAGTVDSPGAAEAQHTRNCVGWCPICRSADLLQGDRPELTEKLVDAALLLVTTLRSLIPPPAAAAAATTRTASGARGGVERIDIR